MKKLTGILLTLCAIILAAMPKWSDFMWQQHENVEKIYVIPLHENVLDTVQSQLEKNGESYALTEYTLTVSDPVLDQKEVQETKLMYFDTTDTVQILKQADRSLEYEKDGYFGTLYLDATELRVGTAMPGTEAANTGYTFLSGPESREESESDEDTLSVRTELTYVGTVSRLEAQTATAAAMYTAQKGENQKRITFAVLAAAMLFLLGLFLGLPREHRKRAAEDSLDELMKPSAVPVSAAPEITPAVRPETRGSTGQTVSRPAHESAQEAEVHTPKFLTYLERSSDDTMKGED